MASEGLEYSEVALLVRGALNAGRLKLHKNGVVFKATKTGKLDQVNKDDIEAAFWRRVARGQELKIVLKSGAQFRYNGFKDSDYQNLSAFLSQFYNIKIEDTELSVKGWNWGTAKFRGTALSFEVDEKPAFEIPLKDVSQATTAGNNEVTLEFHQHDDAEVSLMEMRFYIPSGTDGGDADPVKTFHDHVISKADIIQITGDAIVTIPDVACLTPRGRYTMKVFPAFMQLHGKTYDYKIPYTTILRLFLLPHKDQRFMFFVVSMDPPIKQGQTRYPFLITQFEKHEEFDVKLNMTEEEIKEKYDDKITQEMSGPVYEIISKLMKAVVGKKITVPGSFKSHSGASGMTCSYRAGSGLLYPLERGFIFVHKPPVHVRFDEISCVNFARVSGGGSSSKSFDFEVETKNGTVIVFSNIEREEYSRLFDFVTAKNLRIKNTGKVKNSSKDKKYDEDLFNSDDDQHDAYLEQVKAEAAERDSESEEDDSDDESFAPDDESDRDVKEEFDSEASSSSEEGGSGSDTEKKAKKSKKHKPEKKRKAEKQKSPKKKAPKSDVATPLPGTKSTRKKGKKKDPNAPKRAMSAYMLWLAEARVQIKEEKPGISVIEVSKIAGEKWRSVTDKPKWEKQAAIEREKYQERMKEYKKGLLESGEASSSKPETPTKSKKKKAEPKPKTSPRKSVDGQKFKSAEFIESSGGSSDSDDDSKKPKKSKDKSKKKKKKHESEDESIKEEVSEEEELSGGGSDSD